MYLLFRNNYKKSFELYFKRFDVDKAVVSLKLVFIVGLSK